MYKRQLLSRTSIDGSIFFTCTTCIVYQYFKELAAFVSKAGAKVKACLLYTSHLVSRLLLPTNRPVQTRFRFGYTF